MQTLFSMRHRSGLVAGGLFVVAIAAGVSHSWKLTAQTRPATDVAALRARGDYLTHHVAMCVECHSPRDERGTIIATEEFQGAPVLVNAPYWRPDWAIREPNIAGLRGYTDDQVITLLMTGQASGRSAPNRPMPPFRLTREDAEAIVAYLRTR